MNEIEASPQDADMFRVLRFMQQLGWKMLMRDTGATLQWHELQPHHKIVLVAPGEDLEAMRERWCHAAT